MRLRRRTEREPTIALINIVFLMLIFFLVAGTLARPLDGALSLIRTADLEGAAPPDALVIHPDGRLAWRGEPVGDAASFLSDQPEDARETVRLVPDRDLPARALVAIANELRAAGAHRVLVVTERGME